MARDRVARLRPVEGIDVHPVDARRWADLEALFGPSGAYSGCWCMFFRQSGAEFSAKCGKPNRGELHDLVAANEQVGLLAYEKSGAPVGWAAVAPRSDYGRLRRSPFLVGDPDDRQIWSIACLFVDTAHRGRGVPDALVIAACDQARAKGAKVIEAVPWDESREDKASLFVGWGALFDRHGFRRVAKPRPNSSRIVMRRTL